MKTDLTDIQLSLQGALADHDPHLQVRVHSEKNFEVAGTKEVMQGKQKVSGHYFASVMPKPKDIRLYFFPIYTHKEEFPALSEDLQKALKGKSCFHIKKLSPEMEQEIQEMISRGVELYRRDQLI
ncbi:MAG: hypothetical protein AAFR61_26515 [Bacteroidota bacterium]